MSFDSPLFLTLFVAVFVCLRKLPRYGGIILLASSVIFYSFAGIVDMAVIVAMVCINFFLSHYVLIGKRWLILAIAVNLAVLGFFKYRYFIFPEPAVDQFKSFFNAEILIPIGVSFYVFQAIAYQVDLYNRRTSHISSFWHFSLFILLFPHMMAGPIVRANVLEPQVEKAYAGKIKGRKFWILGLGLCLLGLMKKVGLADSLAPYVDAVFSQGPSDTYTAWLGALLFSFQIYFDFSGYSDIAVGIAYLIGFKLPMNFRQPYLAVNPKEFWQRWHITLSLWIRDYVYIPLGGDRVGGIAGHFVVMVVTMGLAGLWHGANWTFLAWGGLWGLYAWSWRLMPIYIRRNNYLSWSINIMVVMLLWVMFRVESLDQAFAFYRGMWGSPEGQYSLKGNTLDMLYAVSGIGLLFFSQFIEARFVQFAWLRKYKRLDKPLTWGLMIGLMFWIIMMPKQQLNPFIYFRF